MIADRRTFLAPAGGALAYQSAPAARARSDGRCKAIVFDALAIFDSRPVATLAEALYPNSGSALMNAWRSRQFEYQWLHALGRSYVDFLRATEDSLVHAAKQLRLQLSAEQRDRLMSGWIHLRIWPDTSDGV
jgi:2-haloacid dehalogenase